MRFAVILLVAVHALAFAQAQQQPPIRVIVDQGIVADQLRAKEIKLHEHEIQQSEMNAYGKQLLENYKTARQAILDDLKIKQDMRKEKQIAAAMALVATLDPADLRVPI